MTVRKEATIERYIGLSTDAKPTGVPPGSTFLEYDTQTIYVTHDGGTNWVLKEPYGEVKASPTTNTILGRLKALLTDIVLAAGTNQTGARSKCALLNSGVLSADTAVKSVAGEVYWLTVSDTTALSVELNDSTDNTGTDKWAIVLPANAYAHFIFDPPIEFGTGIYLDVSTATCKVVIGYK